MEIFFNPNCESIDSLIIKKNNNRIILKTIIVDSSSNAASDSLFMFNFLNEKEIFKYDFR